MKDKKPKIAVPDADEVQRFGGLSDESADSSEAATPSQGASSAGQSVDALIKERDELKDKLLRATAEQANIAKRLGQQNAESLKFAGMGLARAILPILDNLERTIESISKTAPDDPFAAGVKLNTEELIKVLKSYGVEPIDSVGKHFDPSLHEALMHDKESDLPPGTVSSEYQRGYTMHGKVLRPARVAVVAEPEESDANQASE